MARLRAAGCVFAEEEAALLEEAAAAGATLEQLVRDRVAGVPLEQVLGWAEFAGLRIAVRPGVFVPRRRSELLVRLAAPLLGAHGIAVDVCCGSGALGAALLARRPGAEVHACDVDPVAVACARENLPGERVHEGDLYAALPHRLRGRVDVLVANAPYVPTGSIATMPSEARDHEHPVALDGGVDGLAVQARVAAGAPAWLRPGGALLVETSRAQAAASAALLARSGLVATVERDDDLDATVALGRLLHHVPSIPPGGRA